MRRSQLKKQILALLADQPLTALPEQLKRYREEETISPLFSALCSADALLHWQAVYAFGLIVPRLAARDMEAARIVMRRFLWSLNEESGGIGWGAPEALAEIMANSPPLADEYLHMLISYLLEDGPEEHQEGNFLELPMLQRGLLWGIGRIAAAQRERLLAAEVPAALGKYLASEDAMVRGLAVWALCQLGSAAHRAVVSRLAGEPVIIEIFTAGGLRQIPVRQLVAEYLRMVAGQQHAAL